MLIVLHRAMLNLRSYSLADEFISKRRARRTGAGNSSKTVLPAEVDAKLDYKEGLETYHRDDEWRKGTIEHFRHNLQTMVSISRSAGIPIILMNPVSNLKDCPPFKSEFSAGLSDREIKRVTELWEEAEKLSWDDVYGKIRLLEKAARIDNRHAGILYMIGKCYEHLGRLEEAKKWFLSAKEEDVCPLRILEPMNDAVISVAAKNNVPLVDAKRLFEGRSQEKIPGDEWMLDHVHPTIEGHQLIADSLSEAMGDIELVSTPEGWRSKKDELWKQHLSSLSNDYFEQGFTRLNRLRNWSRGPKDSPTPADFLEE
jgi:lysophospholipase L1-like esterase